MSAINTIVIGGLNTDIIAEGIRRFPEIGGHVYGKQLRIGPGGTFLFRTSLISF